MKACNYKGRMSDEMKACRSITIPYLVKRFRKEAGLTQEEFSSILGVTPQAVSKWERGKCYPDITFLPLLAEALNCTVNDFFE